MDQTAGQVIGWLFLGFWVVVAAAVVVRLVLTLRRRRGSSLRDSVLRPMLGASTAAVWPTLDPRTSEHLEHVDGGAAHRVETSLVEPSPEERLPEERSPGEPSSRKQMLGASSLKEAGESRGQCEDHSCEYSPE